MTTFLYTIIIYPLIQIIEFVFMLFNDVFKKPGIAVIGVSFGVSLLCLPLYIVAERWQQVQRDIEKTLAPGMQRIKQTFSGDEQYMILTTFYKEHHYHPLMALRSSFGLLIQVPFFIAAYSFLSALPALQGQSFMFIKDMGKPDALFTIGSFQINILPVAMTVINIIAGAIYTKGFKLKDKIQIYGMALVFLVILYTSPSGLVLYWTMNNVFSLVKNVFYKIRRPLLVLYVLMAVCVAGMDYYVLFIHQGLNHKRILLAVAASSLLLIPLLVKAVQKLLSTVFQPLVKNSRTRFIVFICSAAALCLLAGFVIPSYVINSSAVEFADIDGHGSPLYFLYISTLQMFGLLVFWPVCVYFLFHARIQTLLAVFMPVILLASLVNAFVFSGDYGTLSRLITFSQSVSVASAGTVIQNLLLVLVAIIVPVLLLKLNRPAVLSTLVTIILLAEAGITAVHTAQIHGAYREYRKTVAGGITEQDSLTPLYHLSKTGKNVIVIMFDRAENAYVEPIFNAHPELYDIYTGFTFYRNVVSYNAWTLMGSPGLYGGYEYVPVEMNKRDTEKLVDKHNEALLTMPRVFTEQADFKAYVSDLSWANYSWIADMKICDPYEKITGFNTERRFSSLWVKENPDKVRPNTTSSAIKRNLVWFSLFKSLPVVMRDSIYDDGNWWASDSQSSDIMEFIDYYSAVDYLPRLTDFSCGSNAFLLIVNELTHSGQRLQAPDYVPTINVTRHGPLTYSSVDGNIAAYKRFGEFIQYLKDNGCYDNTKIILVSDHGIGSGDGKKLDFPADWPMSYNTDHLHPILFYKDFNASGKMQINNDFMTNADVPSLAFQGVIDHPVNPATGKEISVVPPSQKKASGITISHNWRPGSNNANTYRVPDEDWYTVSENIFDAKNWHKGIH